MLSLVLGCYHVSTSILAPLLELELLLYRWYMYIHKGINQVCAGYKHAHVYTCQSVTVYKDSYCACVAICNTPRYVEAVSAAVEQCGCLTLKDICGIEYERATGAVLRNKPHAPH